MSEGQKTEDLAFLSLKDANNALRKLEGYTVLSTVADSDNATIVLGSGPHRVTLQFPLLDESSLSARLASWAVP